MDCLMQKYFFLLNQVFFHWPEVSKICVYNQANKLFSFTILIILAFNNNNNIIVDKVFISRRIGGGDIAYWMYSQYRNQDYFLLY